MPSLPVPDRDSILGAIRTFVAQWFRDGREHDLQDDTPLVTSGIIDSAGVVEVVDFVEGRFGVRLGDADLSLANCNTLAGWTELVASRVG